MAAQNKLTRISPGMYRDASGKVVGSRGQAIPQQPRPMQRPMANLEADSMNQRGGPIQDAMLRVNPGFQPGDFDKMLRLPPGTQPGAFGNALGGRFTKPALIPSTGQKPEMGLSKPENLALQITPEKRQQMIQQYEDAKNYRPDYKESLPASEQGFLARKKYADMAKRRERVLNNPLNPMRLEQNSPERRGAWADWSGGLIPGNS